MIDDARFAWMCATLAAMGHLCALASANVVAWRLWLSVAVVVGNMGAFWYVLAKGIRRG